MKQPSRTLLWVIAVSLLIAFALLAWRSMAMAAPAHPATAILAAPGQPGTPWTTLGSDTLSPEMPAAPVPGGPGFYAQSSSAFVPYNSTTPYARNGVALYNPGGPGVFLAPVSLPNGATVNKFVVYYYDNDATAGNDLAALLSVGADLSQTGSPMAVVSSSGANPNPVSHQTTAISAPVINSQANQYWIEIHLPTSSSVRIIGFRIDYHYPTYVPLLQR